MQIPERNSGTVGQISFGGRFLYDFELCADLQELKQTLGDINRLGYKLVTVTQDGSGMYTVFFKRRICG